MTREQYVNILHELLSGDPARVREANRKLFSTTVQDADACDTMDGQLAADMALADAAQ